MRFVTFILCTAILVVSAGCWRKDVGRSYYPSGKLRTEATVKNNVVDGAAVMYYENGKKQSEAHYRSGVLNGLSTAYYESGARKAQAEYKDGVLHGTSAAWNEAGVVQSEARFEDGRLVQAVAPATSPAVAATPASAARAGNKP